MTASIDTALIVAMQDSDAQIFMQPGSFVEATTA